MNATSTYFRATVNSWTPALITAESSQGIIAISYGSDNLYMKDHDWGYLRELLRRGCSINVVHPHWEGDLCLPELIIVEPDLLMDITAVAACIEDYAESPLVSLLGKLKPGQHSSATLLGNFASQLLDEALRHLDRPYAESVADFFRAYPLQLATTDISSSFHSEAQKQSEHIRDCISHELQEQFAGFQPDDTVLEPTFFCEMLGLQGRMDLLQLDYAMLVEQKSGRSARVVGASPTDVIAQRKHEVQALLYYAVLHYGMDIAEGHIAPFLLYSKYPEGLLSVPASADLLHLAICLRNRLARCEQIYAEFGYGVLRTLTPDKIRMRQGDDILWQRYTRPQFEALLAPISQASPLETAYYMRLMRFVSAEHLLSKFNPLQSEGTDFAAKWRYSLEEKRQMGNIFDSLRLCHPSSAADTDIRKVTFHLPASSANYSASRNSYSASSANYSASSENTTNFREGDIVVLYPYAPDSEPDVRRVPCLRGTLSSISPDCITVRLNAPQSTAHYFFHFHGLWAIEHDLYESSATTLYRGLHAFLSAPKERRDLLLSQRRPQTDGSLSLRGDYGAFNDLALRVRQARELFLIIGPPGTGKTSFGLMTTLQEELCDPEASVLILSYTNRAVDEACSKLIEAGLDFIRIGGTLSCSEECRPYLLETRMSQIDGAEGVRQLVKRTRIFAGTTATLCNHQELFALKAFSLAIIDEASQILETQLMPLLAHPEIHKVVMIGDHKQLPAVVQQSAEQSAVTEPALRAIGLTDCRRSLFERLLSTYRHDPTIVYMLRRQGRMHPEVALYPNQAFYAGQLESASLPHQLEASEVQRVCFHHVAPLPDSPSPKVNTAEAQVIAQIVGQLAEEGYQPATDIGIIVPYRNQISAIRTHLALTHPTLPLPMIDTVERYQGSQRRVIIYGFTVSQPYQLEFLTAQCFEEDGVMIDRKLNVALTRAMERIHLVGNATLLQQNAVFRQLLSSVPQA